jgi:tagaturonate reductase
MQDDVFKNYVKNLMEIEIGPSITSEEIPVQEVNEFSNSVIDRFSNPFLDHQWTAIAMNYSSKIAMRCIPLLAKWYAKYDTTPHYMAFGIASFLKLHAESEGKSTDELIQDKELWEQDLTAYPDFVNQINANLEIIANQGVLKAIAQIV